MFARQTSSIFTVLSLATKNSWKDQNGDWQSHAEWHRAVVWGEKFSDFAATLKKGAHVQVEGPLRSREYEKDGVKHRVFECKAESILKLDRAERQATRPGGTISGIVYAKVAATTGGLFPNSACDRDRARVTPDPRVGDKPATWVPGCFRPPVSSSI